MPGHVVKSTGPDPDPMPWLAVSEELKKKLMTKPYDAKKSCWVPDKSSGGFLEGLIQEKDGDKVTVEIVDTKEVSTNNLHGFVMGQKWGIYIYIYIYIHIIVGTF